MGNIFLSYAAFKILQIMVLNSPTLSSLSPQLEKVQAQQQDAMQPKINK